MKIALIGEQSGVHLTLAKALRRAGHKVRIFSSGDGFKRIPGDVSLPKLPPGFVARMKFAIREIPSFARMLSTEFDIIQLVNPHILPMVRSGLYTTSIMRLLRSNGAQLTLLVVGCDSRTQSGLSQMRRSPCPGCLSDYGVASCPFIIRGRPLINEAVEKAVSKVFTMGGASYARSYSSHPKLHTPLPLPIDPETVRSPRNHRSGPIRIFHGISRAGFKGSGVILDALSQVKTELGTRVEITTSQGLPYSEYLKTMSRADVVVDQMYGDGIGMNALQAMAASSAVLTAVDKHDFGSVRYSQAPVINIAEDAQGIATQLRELAEMGRGKLTEIQEASRNYVIRHHNSNTIAKEMVDAWESP